MKYTIEHKRDLFGEPRIEICRGRKTIVIVSDTLLRDLLIILKGDKEQIRTEFEFMIRWEINRDEDRARENSSPERIKALLESGELMSFEQKENLIKDMWTEIDKYGQKVKFWS